MTTYKRYELTPTTYEVFKVIDKYSNKIIDRQVLLDELNWNRLRVGNLMRAIYKLQDLRLFNIKIRYDKNKVTLEIKRNYQEWKSYRNGKKYILFVKISKQM